MALLQYRAPVKYSEQSEILKDFLQNFKSFETVDAIEGLNLGEDVDDDDLMEDAEADGRGTTERRRKGPKVKYMQLLQDIADRIQHNIVIELDDLESVSLHACCLDRIPANTLVRCTVHQDFAR